MGTLSKVRDNSQRIIWAFLIIFILSMAAGGLMGGYNLVGQFKTWMGFNTSDQHAFSIDGERILHGNYVQTYESDLSVTDDNINLDAHTSTLERFKNRHVINNLYTEIFESDEISDIDKLNYMSNTQNLLRNRDEVLLAILFTTPLKESEKFTDTNKNGIWDAADTFTDAGEKNGIWDEGETLTRDSNENGIWDDAEPFTDEKNNKYDPGENYTDKGNGKYDEGEEFTDTNENDKWDEGEEYTDKGNGKYDEGEEFTDEGNGVWDSNSEEWILKSFKNGKIDYTSIQDSIVRENFELALNQRSTSIKRMKLASVFDAFDYKTNKEIDFDNKLNNTSASINYIKYDLSNIDEKEVKIDQEKIKSSITPYEKMNSGVSIITLIIICMLLIIFSYINRESRAKLSFGLLFFIIFLLTTIFKTIDYNKQGSNKIRTISYVYIDKSKFGEKMTPNGEYNEGEKFTDTNADQKWNEGEKWEDSEFEDSNGNGKYDGPDKGFSKAQDEVLKGITEKGFNEQSLKNNKLFSLENKLTKSFTKSPGEINDLIGANNLLLEAINKTFETNLKGHFIVENKVDGKVEGVLIGHVKEEDNYYEYMEYKKLEKEYIQEEKEKIAKSRLEKIVDLKDLNKDNVESQFNQIATNNEEVEALSDEGNIKSLIQTNPTILGTLHQMNDGETSNIIFTDEAAYIIFMNEKVAEEEEIDYDTVNNDYKKQKERTSVSITDSDYFKDRLNSLNVNDWRDEASINITVDPDYGTTQSVNNLYFDLNSYKQYRALLTNR